jgi:hypothetical protein
MLTKALAAAALAAGVLGVSALPAAAGPNTTLTPASIPTVLASPAAAATDQQCSAWDQVTPGVWAIICLYRSGGALFQPIATVVNQSGLPVAVDEFVYLNGNITNICGTWPNPNLPAGGTLACTNNTWLTAASPRVGSATFMVNTAPVKTLYAPSFA